MTNSQYRSLRKELGRLYILNSTDRVQFFAVIPAIRRRFGLLQADFTDVWCEFCNERFRASKATNPDQLGLDIDGVSYE
jgi:hypothetical protein